MITLKRFMTLKGRFSFDDLAGYFKEELDSRVEELFELIEEKEVSVHTDGLGNCWHRYPYFTTKGEERMERGEDKLDALLEYIRKHPMSNGQEIKKGLNLSQEAFDTRKERLLGQGAIVQSKEGRAILYRVKPTAHGDLRAVDSQVRKPDPFSRGVPIAHGPEDGRFMNPKHNRELSDLDKKIIEQIEMYEDDREIDNLAEDCDVGPDQRKAYMRSLSKLYGDGYIGKVVEGDNVMYCSIERV